MLRAASIGRRVVRLRGDDHPRPAAASDRADPVEDSAHRREIGDHHCRDRWPPRDHAGSPAPGRLQLHRPAVQPLQRALMLAVLAHHRAQRLELRTAAQRPAHQRIVIGHDARRRRPFDQQAEVAPPGLLDPGEIAVLDIEPADQDPARFGLAVGKRELLMVPQQVAPAVGRVEAAETRAALAAARENSSRACGCCRNRRSGARPRRRGRSRESSASLTRAPVRSAV